MLYVGACYGVYFLISGSHVAAMFTDWGSTIGVCNARTLCILPWQACVPHGDDPWLMPGVQWVTAHSTILSRGNFILLIHLSSIIPSVLWGRQLWVLSRHPIPPTSLHGQERSFPGIIPPSYTVYSKSVVDIKPLVILVWWLGIRLMNLVVPGGQSALLLDHTNPLPSWTRLWELLLYGTSKDFEHGFDSILLDSGNTPELEVSFDESDAMPSSASSGFLCLNNIHSDNYRLQLDARIKCHTFGCQAKAFLLSVLQVGEMSSSKLFCHVFLLIQQHLDSGQLCHLLTSLLTFLIFRLALVQWLMPF